MISLIVNAMAATLLIAVMQSAYASNVLEGVWEARVYRLKGGVEHAVRGRIFFTEDQWTVLFFVLDGDHQPVRASAEGGTYRTDGEQLIFVHQYHFSGGEKLQGLPAAPFKMSVRETGGESEPCRFHIVGRELTIFFPSGNSMRFSAPPE